MPTSAPTLDDLYDEAGYKYNVDPLRIKAHAIQETGERAKVASGDGKSWGFGQFRPETWATVMPGVPLSARGDPATAIEAMGKYLARLDAAHTDASGNTDVRASTAAYNGAGPAADAYAESVRAIHARLVKSGGLKTAAGQAPAANDDDAFGQTLKASPAPAAPDKVAPDKAAAEDAFEQTLKGGPAQETTAKPGVGPDALGLDIEKMVGQPDYAGAVKMGRDLSTPAGMRNALEPPAGWTTSGILPMATKTDPATGDGNPSLGMRWDLGPLRPLATGVLDLLEGKDTGTITPEARNVLFGAMTGGQLLPSVARGSGAAVAGAMQAAADRTAAPLSPEFTSNPLSPNYAGPREMVPPGQITAAATPGMGAPQPQSGGAAASSAAEATMTPAEIAANRHVAEKDWLNSTIQPGVEDNRLLVEGNNPTLAQREQNAATSREQKSLTQQNPQLAQEEQELLDLHDTNRKRMYQQPDLAGSTVLLNNAEKAAKDRLDAGLNAAFANKTAADAQPVVTMADKFLSGREGKRAAIETEVKSVRARLFDAEGNLETDPEILWGVREHINDVLSQENQRQNPVSGRAQSELIKLRDALDGVIDPAAPGFTKAIKGYAEEMKPLDVMRALQERENGLYDSKGRMQFSRFHSLMRDIVDARQPGAALSPFQHISDNQMAKLQNLHDDLKRAATAQDLAAAKGSDSAQNLWDATKTYAKGRGTAALNMIPYVGGLVRHGQEAYAPYKEMKAQQNALNRGIEMLRPPPDKYPTRNPLEGP